MASQQDLNRAASGKDAWNHWADANKNCDVDFSGHVFTSAADFEGFTFPGSANFSYCQFLGIALFSGATFVGNADFSHATFEEYVALDRITFQHDAIFEHSRFGRQHTYIVHSMFTHANFRSSTFDGTFELTGSKFRGETDFTRATFEEPIFKGVQFKHPLTTFAFATFNEVPDFRNSSFEFPPILYGMSVRDLTVERPAAAEARAENADKYRRLKVLASDAKDYQSELRFFADELRAKRGHETKGWGAILLNKAYERFSNFGQSVARPIGWLVVLILLSAVIRVVACLPLSLGAMGPHFAMALADTAQLIGSDKWAMRIDAMPQAVAACSTNYGLLQHVAALFQSGLGLMLLFLAGLGLRNRFRIGGGN